MLSIGIILSLFIFIFSGEASAMNGLSMAVGAGEESTTRYDIGFQKDWEKQWFAERAWHLSGYWEAGVGYWDGDSGKKGKGSLTTISFTPVFRLQRPSGNGLLPYIDLAVGFNLLSDTTIGDRDLSTAFQFGDLIGVGFRFGRKQAFEIGYRFEHLSNADIKTPNPGINFHLLRLVYWGLPGF